jgi:hypothetical protein
MTNRIIDMNGQTPDPQNPISFQETMLLNLQRQKGIIEQNIRFFQTKLPMFDEAIEQVKNNSNLSEFAQLMHNLQQGMQQGPPTQQ